MILYRYNAPAKVLVSMAPVALLKETESNDRIGEEDGGVATLASGTNNSMLRDNACGESALVLAHIN